MKTDAAVTNLLFEGTEGARTNGDTERTNEAAKRDANPNARLHEGVRAAREAMHAVYEQWRKRNGAMKELFSSDKTEVRLNGEEYNTHQVMWRERRNGNRTCTSETGANGEDGSNTHSESGKPMVDVDVDRNTRGSGQRPDRTSGGDVNGAWISHRHMLRRHAHSDSMMTFVHDDDVHDDDENYNAFFDFAGFFSFLTTTRGVRGLPPVGVQ